MAENLSNVIRRIEENVGTVLDVKIDLTSFTGRLAPTLTAIRDVLAELDAPFLAKRKGVDKAHDDKPGHKRGDPKRQERPSTFEKDWTAKYGACRHCGGKHWHRDCPRNLKKLSAKSAGGRALVTSDPRHAPSDGNAGAALFAQEGGAIISFSAPTEGRALCTRDAGSSRDSVVPLYRPDRNYFSRFPGGERSPTPSELSIEAQDAAELAKAERDADTGSDTTDSEYDVNRPYSLWEHYYLDDDDGTFDQ
eukprot:6178510-Pleurochrysis_carterae.AAC.5